MPEVWSRNDAGIDPPRSIQDTGIFYPGRGYFMNITENSRNRVSKKNTDETPQVPDSRGSMSSIKHKYLVMSSQGGVGKTSVIVNLALALSKRGLTVDCWMLIFMALTFVECSASKLELKAIQIND